MVPQEQLPALLQVSSGCSWSTGFAGQQWGCVKVGQDINILQLWPEAPPSFTLEAIGWNCAEATQNLFNALSLEKMLCSGSSSAVL